MREYYQNFQNQGSYPNNFLPVNEHEELQEQQLLQDIILNADDTLAEQPALDFTENFLNFPELNNQSLYCVPAQQHPTCLSNIDARPNSTLNTPVYNNPTSDMSNSYKTEEDTRSPLSYSEDNVNLCEIKNEQNLSCLMSDPLFVLSIIPWPGPFNFRVDIPPPNLQGVKPKECGAVEKSYCSSGGSGAVISESMASAPPPQWCFSELLNKLYVARNVAFPINITLDKYVEGAALNICPVFTKSSNRMVPVFRCPNCRMADRNPESSEHVIQVEGSSPYYFYQNDRYMLSVPVGQPAPGDTSLNVFLKVCCNTSCVGGPNRKPFSILITLKLGEREIGRQIIDVKCCEGPLRDMANDEKREHNAKTKENNGDMNAVRQVANDVANIKVEKTSKKRKLTEITLVDSSTSTKDSLDFELLKIPKIYSRKVKKYVNLLHMRAQFKKNNNKVVTYFPSATSESE